MFNTTNDDVIPKPHFRTPAALMTKTLKRSRSGVLSTDQAASPSVAPAVLHETPHKSKKLKLHASYTLESPFPNFAHPTPEEASQVFRILSDAHGTIDPARRSPQTNTNSAASCGGAQNVIEALIETILSQNTTAKNSSAAKASLDAKFGYNNFAAMANAPREEVVEAIKQGGLANKKAATIQQILHSIRHKHGEYSLQHLAAADPKGGHLMADDDIMQELMSYGGVGPKTASCVLLFCLGRDSFAVDTHVYRLSKLLGWVPEKADRVLAQAHLDLRIPNELKYGLHVLMIQHGRSCKGCKKPRGGDCILKDYLKTTCQDPDFGQSVNGIFHLQSN